MSTFITWIIIIVIALYILKKVSERGERRLKAKADFRKIEKSVLDRHLDDSLQIIKETKNLDTLFSRYDFATKRINDEHQTFKIKNKENLISEFDAAVRVSLIRIFTTEIDDAIEKANTLKTLKGRTNRLNRVLQDLDQSVERIPERWLTPKLKENINRARLNVQNEIQTKEKTETVDDQILLQESKCPYCSVKLDPTPSRKKKCPSCEKYVYVRTLPDSREKVLATEKRAYEIDEEWKDFRGPHFEEE